MGVAYVEVHASARIDDGRWMSAAMDQDARRAWDRHDITDPMAPEAAPDLGERTGEARSSKSEQIRTRQKHFAEIGCVWSGTQVCHAVHIQLYVRTPGPMCHDVLPPREGTCNLHSVVKEFRFSHIFSVCVRQLVRSLMGSRDSLPENSWSLECACIQGRGGDAIYLLTTWASI